MLKNYHPTVTTSKDLDNFWDDSKNCVRTPYSFHMHVFMKYNT